MIKLPREVRRAINSRNGWRLEPTQIPNRFKLIPPDATLEVVVFAPGGAYTNDKNTNAHVKRVAKELDKVRNAALVGAK